MNLQTMWIILLQFVATRYNYVQIITLTIKDYILI